MAVLVLNEAERRKLDGSDDALFYAEPRFVQHLDGAFRRRLTALYRERIPPCAVVLDLMSSWVSHLPEEIRYEQVIGHGLNGAELAANPRLIGTGCRTSTRSSAFPWRTPAWMRRCWWRAGSTCSGPNRWRPSCCGWCVLPAR
jgi:hypothetical protein